MSAIIRMYRCLVSPLLARKNCLTPLWRIRGLETENFINTIVSLYQQVPERFLEVAQITLREFFNAIIAGKDVDPSWKKAIYKVICKLDSEVPDIFRSPNCLQELLHEWRFHCWFWMYKSDFYFVACPLPLLPPQVCACECDCNCTSMCTWHTHAYKFCNVLYLYTPPPPLFNDNMWVATIYPPLLNVLLSSL